MTLSDRVIEEFSRTLARQREKGAAKYGEAFEPHDGRDTLQDALEEAVDLVQYIVKAKVEREGLLAMVAESRGLPRD